VPKFNQKRMGDCPKFSSLVFEDIEVFEWYARWEVSLITEYWDCETLCFERS